MFYYECIILLNDSYLHSTLQHEYVTVYEKMGQLAEIMFFQGGPKYLPTRAGTVFAILCLGTGNLMKVSLSELEAL